MQMQSCFQTHIVCFGPSNTGFRWSTTNKRIGFRPMILLILVITALVMFDIPHVLFTITTGYVGWGLFRGTYELWRNWRQGRNVLEDEDEAEADDLGETR